MSLRSIRTTFYLKELVLNRPNVNVCQRKLQQWIVPTRGYVLSNVTGRCICNLQKFHKSQHIKFFSSNSISQQSESSVSEFDPIKFERITTETLESLSDYFDELVENAAHLKDADVSCKDGVLTVKFGGQYGTYVINRQTPNKQIWLSSPISGPKRYDFINDRWVYKHDGKSLHQLLSDEIPKIVKCKTSFDKCLYSDSCDT